MTGVFRFVEEFYKNYDIGNLEGCREIIASHFSRREDRSYYLHFSSVLHFKAGETRAALEKYTRVNQREINSERDRHYRKALMLKAQEAIVVAKNKNNWNEAAELGILSLCSFPGVGSFLFEATNALSAIGAHRLQFDVFHNINDMKNVPECLKILSVDPLVVCTFYNAEAIDCIINLIKDRKVYFLLHNAWTVRNQHYFAKIYNKIKFHKENRNVEFIILAADQQELDFSRSLGLRSELVNHNSLADATIFDTGSRQEKKNYNAVYNAAMASYKRHFLAREIKDLACIYYMQGGNESLSYYRSVKRLLDKAHFLNGDVDVDGGYRRLEPKEVADVYRSSKVGLCLSQEEGAMFASIEYMLCGLPVVSTASTGGRNEFFSDEYCIIAADDQSAVSRAVQDLAERGIDPSYIRERTLSKIREHNERFVTLVDHCTGRVTDNGKINKETGNIITVNEMTSDKSTVFERLRDNLGVSFIDILKQSGSL